MIEDFVIKNPINIGFHTRVLHYNKIIQLSDEQFAQLYLELMTEYRDKDGWWNNDQIPYCNKCHDNIQGPRDLRRYIGMSLHPECFKEVWEKEKKDERNLTMIKYWDRVAQIDLTNNAI